MVSRSTFIIVATSALNWLNVAAQSSTTLQNVTFSSLNRCPVSSLSMSKYGPEDALDPCIVYDIRDSMFETELSSLLNAPSISKMVDAMGLRESINNDENEDTISEITLVQVTPSLCNNHRDGATVSVRKMNAANDGKGMAIGYNRDHYVKFRLISIVGGNNKNTSDEFYTEVHKILLDSVLATVDNAQFIIGSCSFASVADKPIALKRKKIVISQVGPPGFYMDVQQNAYVFGIHVNSDTYPLPALRALQFHLNSAGTATSLQPVRVLYRDKSEFFYSTCRSAIDEATNEGFDVTAIEYDPEGFEDGSDIKNSQNTAFLENLADTLCPPKNENVMASSIDHDGSIVEELPPAIFACVLNDEADAILARLRSNGCRPSLSWFTTATWGWAPENPEVVPYFQGGGQWHENFKYSDEFFETGQDVLNYGLGEFGYLGSYDQVVSYAIPTILATLIESFFRIDDLPDVPGIFSNEYEVIRRALVNLNAETLFGPVSFNEYQRNNGRGAAGMQWIPRSSRSSVQHAIDLESKELSDFVLGCISPLDQADAAIIIPSPSGSVCSPGNYVNHTLIETEAGLLEDKCSACPRDSYSAIDNDHMECIPCPYGSSTLENTGAISCVRENANLIARGFKIMGYLFVIISWSLAIGYIVWMISNKDGSVVKISQPEFLFFICIGAILSTSAIIPLTLAEADVREDTKAASKICQSVPFLYSLGWVLMYSSLTAKSYRLTKLCAAASRMERKSVAAKEMYSIIIAFMVLDLIVLIAWQVYDPLMYVRSVVGKDIDDDTGVITLETIGQCSSTSLWKFLGPIIGIHVSLMVITNVLLWRVRGMSDRYQEQKFIALASVYICELLLLGVPILFAVQDSAGARYIVIVGLIFLTDTGVLSLIFIPKIKFQNKGLPAGMTVVQSMNMRSSIVCHRRSSVRSIVDSHGNDNSEMEFTDHKRTGLDHSPIDRAGHGGKDSSEYNASDRSFLSDERDNRAQTNHNSVPFLDDLESSSPSTKPK
jgi:hypothetical protein